ncbi:MAG: tetratricopeptide repeat protein [Aquisalimonadaceae bacterium]
MTALGLMALVLGGCATVPEGDADTAYQDPAEDLRILEQREPPVEDDRNLMYQLLVAEFASVRGQLSAALEAYLKAMRLTEDPQIAARATRISIYSNQDVKGQDAAARWVELDPDDLSARQALAVFHLRNGNADQARRQFRELVVRSDDPAAAFAQIGGGLGREEDADASLAVLKSLAESFSDVPEAHLVYAQAALRSGEADVAVTAADAGLDVAPDSRELATLRAQALIESGRVDAGRAAFETLIERYPGDGELRLYLARTLLDAGREQDALRHFRQVLVDRPNDAGVLYATGLLTLDAGHPKEARPYFLRLVELGERTNEAYYFLGQIAEDRARIEDALRWYEQVEGDNRLAAKLRRAVLLGDLGRLGASRTLLEQVREQHPAESVRGYLVEGEVLRRNQLYDEAISLYADALERHPGNTDLIYGRALTAVLQDNVDSAERDLRYILERDPDNAQALNALGYTLVDVTDRHQEGFELIQRAHSMDPDNAAILDSMGWAHYRLGNYQEALTFLRRAHEQMPDAEVSAHLGEVLWAMGERQEARRIWRQALDEAPDDPALKETMQRLDPS